MNLHKNRAMIMDIARHFSASLFLSHFHRCRPRTRRRSFYRFAPFEAECLDAVLVQGFATNAAGTDEIDVALGLPALDADGSGRLDADEFAAGYARSLGHALVGSVNLAV
jgi:hypothetical protein